MNALAWTLLGVAGVIAVGNWIAVSPGIVSRPAECALKPATLAAIIGMAITLQPDIASQRAWFVAALVLSLAGDVLLMLPSDAFAAGLSAFLLAHVAYIGGLNAERSSGLALGVAAVVVVAALLPVARRLLQGVRAGEHRWLLGPVAAYVAVISTMAAFALATKDPVAATGAVLFVLSDLMIGWNRFVRPLPWVRPAIMSTYHVAQMALALSLLG